MVVSLTYSITLVSVVASYCFYSSCQIVGGVTASDGTLEGARSCRMALPNLPIHFSSALSPETAKGTSARGLINVASFTPWHDSLRQPDMQRDVYPLEICLPFLLVMHYLVGFKNRDSRSFWRRI